MKILIHLLLLLLAIGTVGSSIAQQFQTFTDSRDSKTYKTVRIGNQIWMAENLKFNPQRGNYFIYGNDPVNYDKYGYLYDWSIACNVCPSGWRLPTNADFLELTNQLGVNYKPLMMKTNGWPQADGATNSSGFSGLPGGVRDHQGNFRNIGMGAYFWTSTGIDGTWAYARELGLNAGNWASSEFGSNKMIGMSVRCVQDAGSSSKDADDAGEVLDDEYVESEYEEPEPMQYSSDYSIKKGLTEYNVFQTENCREQQDGYYNYTGEYKCQPIKTESYKFSINIHLNDPMYSEALVKMTNLKTKQVDEYEIEYIEEMDDGSLSFVFHVINQPHQFILNSAKKSITWYSEWGHWTATYYYK